MTGARPRDRGHGADGRPPAAATRASTGIADAGATRAPGRVAPPTARRARRHRRSPPQRAPTQRPAVGAAAYGGERRRVTRRGAGPPAAAPRTPRATADREPVTRQAATSDPIRASGLDANIKTTKPLLATRFGAGRPRFRLIATLASLLLVIGFVLAKVGLLQAARRRRAAGPAAELWTRTRALPAQRGAIFDRNGNELALSVPAATVAVNPKQIETATGTDRDPRPAPRH